MYRDRMDLRIKLAVMPYSDMTFYHRDFIREIGSQRSSSDYRKYMENELLPGILPALHRTERIYQLDEVGLLAEKLYAHRYMTAATNQGQSPGGFHISRLKELSRLFLTHRNGRVALKYWESSEEKSDHGALFQTYRGIYKVALWNSLNRMMCTDLLVMVYLLMNGMDDEEVLSVYHTLVHVPDTQLDAVLEQGLAETHLHLSASGQFALNWQVLMAPNSKSARRSKSVNLTFVDRMAGKSEDLQLYTVAAAIVRLLLASFLQADLRRPSGSELSMSDYLASLNARETNAGMNRLIEVVLSGASLSSEGFTEKDLIELYEGIEISLALPDMSVERQAKTWSDEMAGRDSLVRIFGNGIVYTSMENLLMFRSVRYLMDKNRGDDPIFSRLFWQYVRVKNEQFTRMVQHNHIRGLPYFKEYFKTATEVELAQDERSKLGYLLHHQLQSHHIRKLEVRIAPPSGSNVQTRKTNLARKMIHLLSAYRDIVAEMQTARPHYPVPLLGVIFHFIKTPDSMSQEKCWFDYDDRERNVQKLNFLENQLRYKDEMTAIRELREEIPGLADYLVGIDAANVETHTEPWVFAPIFKQARNSDTHRMVYRTMPQQTIRNLGLTYHVGEDFRHMLSGLRYIDEVIEHFQFRAGDRIGHGMVLGVKAEMWAARNRVIVLPRIELLENMLWIWGMCKDGAVNGLDLSYLEVRILRVAERIYASMNGITVYHLWRAYRSKFEEIEATKLSCVEQSRKDDWFAEQFNDDTRWTGEMLKHTYHCKCYLTRMQEPVELEITHEEEKLISQIQQIVKNRVIKEGIVIETNPTSNAAIGEIENIFEHYILNLNDRGLRKDSPGQGVMVTINTDDPVVFNTNIGNEYAYIFFSLLEKGYDREDVLAWIEHVRITGLRSSFIPSREISISSLELELNQLIDETNRYLKG